MGTGRFADQLSLWNEEVEGRRRCRVGGRWGGAISGGRWKK